MESITSSLSRTYSFHEDYRFHEANLEPAPFIKVNRLMVTLRAIFETLNLFQKELALLGKPTLSLKPVDKVQLPGYKIELCNLIHFHAEKYNENFKILELMVGPINKQNFNRLMDLEEFSLQKQDTIELLTAQTIEFAPSRWRNERPRMDIVDSCLQCPSKLSREQNP